MTFDINYRGRGSSEETYQPPELTEKVNLTDNTIGFSESPITIVEYGDYDCPHCAYFAEIIRSILKEYGGRIRFVFRHFPLESIHPNARLAAKAAEAAANQGKFWEMHQRLYERKDHSYPAIIQYAEDLELDMEKFEQDLESEEIDNRIDEDFEQGLRSGVNGTPTIFINDRRYDGAWDKESIIEFIEQPPGVKIELLTQRFTEQAVSGGIMLFAFTILALLWANSPFGEMYFEILDSYLDLSVAEFEFIHKSVEHFINDGLMAIFFFLVGLEIKRELLTGELSDLSKASLPIIAALGGAIVPALLYVLANIGNPEGMAGWGIVMATDIAFLLVIMTFLDNRIPNALRIFFSALAIVDDILAILIISIFYTESLALSYLVGAGMVFAVLLILNRSKVYQKLPYLLLGIAMWWLILQSGIHATVAGVLLAVTIPTRKTPDTKALIAQCSSLLNESGMPEQDDEELKHSTIQTLESISQRIQSPLESLEHDVQPWTTYLILPVFALANAGIALAGFTLASLGNSITLGIILGLVIGKPLGIMIFSYGAVRLGIADLPGQVSWKSLFSVSWLAGIGFTMSLFISNLAFADGVFIDEAKIGILLASTIATIIGLVLGFQYNDPIGGDRSKMGVQHSH